MDMTLLFPRTECDTPEIPFRSSHRGGSMSLDRSEPQTKPPGMGHNVPILCSSKDTPVGSHNRKAHSLTSRAPKPTQFQEPQVTETKRATTAPENLRLGAAPPTSPSPSSSPRLLRCCALRHKQRATVEGRPGDVLVTPLHLLLGIPRGFPSQLQSPPGVHLNPK